MAARLPDALTRPPLVPTLMATYAGAGHAMVKRTPLHELQKAAGDRIATLMHEQPIVLGAFGLALGAVIGAALPRTDAEDRVMGATSDQVKAGGVDMFAGEFVVLDHLREVPFQPEPVRGRLIPRSVVVNLDAVNAAGWFRHLAHLRPGFAVVFRPEPVHGIAAGHAH